MANLPALVVLTLLQLCRAEISDTLPETWYSANVINDGFQPKSISEIFTTDTSFSTGNPIIVLPTSSAPGEIAYFSTHAPPPQVSTDSSTLTDFTKVSVTPLSPSTIPPTPPTQTEQTQRTTFRETIETSSPTPLVTRDQRTTQELYQPQLNLPQSRFELLPVDQVQPVTVQSAPQTSIPQQNINPQSTNQPQLSAAREPLSNYFLIYQQAPQNIQGYAPPIPILGSGSQASISGANPALTTPSTTTTPVFISTTQSPIVTSLIPVSSTLPPISSSTSPTSLSTLLSSTVRTVSIPATQTFSTSRVSNTPTRNTLCPNPPVTTPIPKIPLAGVPYPLRIRVVAPTGSITNVNINPVTTRSSTTRRPNTTRAKRVSKPKRNSYDRCINSCKGNKDPICTIPLGSPSIDQSTLKGFPSVCHMACHNSYRKDPYEKVLDGRCGRLRTRIQSVGSKNKLTRNELNKAQYTVETSGAGQTFVEFSGALR